MGIYRFLNKEHVGSLLNGCLRFGSLQRYRLLEEIKGDKWIGDRREYVSESLIEKASSNSPADRDLFKSLKNDGAISVNGSCEVVIQNVKIIKNGNGFVFSMCAGEIEELKESMCNPKDDSAYDACIEIKNVELLCAKIWSHGTVDGTPIPDLFFSISHDRVAYDWDIASYIPYGTFPSPFKKLPSYQKQSEYRIFLEPKTNIAKNHIFIRLNDKVDLFKEIDLSLSPRETYDQKESIRELQDEVYLDSIKILTFYLLEAATMKRRIFSDDDRANIRKSIYLNYWTLRERNPEMYQDNDIDNYIQYRCPDASLYAIFLNYPKNKMAPK
ncbi:hypothetical protein ACCD06_10815 [Azospirillum sp. CT11-132]|uniref:hypothetical protein n=1 Tax=Azospirillum sp. CT11-132 TaxID=3396317 RepID=UPI0039A66371